MKLRMSSFLPKLAHSSHEFVCDEACKLLNGLADGCAHTRRCSGTWRGELTACACLVGQPPSPSPAPHNNEHRFWFPAVAIYKTNLLLVLSGFYDNKNVKLYPTRTLNNEHRFAAAGRLERFQNDECLWAPSCAGGP